MDVHSKTSTGNYKPLSVSYTFGRSLYWVLVICLKIIIATHCWYRDTMNFHILAYLDSLVSVNVLLFSKAQMIIKMLPTQYF